MFAYIPARGGSKRIPRKNIKTVGGKPAICHVIENLQQTVGLKGIAVSSDDEEILAIATAQPGVVTLAPRSAELANDGATFVDLIRKDIPRFSEYFQTSQVLFVTPTAVLVPAKSFQEAIDLTQKNPAGTVIAVAEYQTSAFLSLVDDGAGSVVALHQESYALPTKDLPPTYYDCGCFYAFDASSFWGGQPVRTFFDLPPTRKVVVRREFGIDVDNMDDWAMLEKVYASLRDK